MDSVQNVFFIYAIVGLQAQNVCCISGASLGKHREILTIYL